VIGDPRSGRINMHSEPATAPPASPAAGIDPPSSAEMTAVATRPPTSTSSPRRSPPVRLARKAMSVLRGDKYMVGAYPPEWRASATRPDTAARTDGTATTVADVVPATPSKGG
jgi:hypothetical protein